MDFSFIPASLPYLADGLAVTLTLSLLSLCGSILLGVVLALLRTSSHWFLRWPAILYIDVLRMTPLIMVIFWFFFLLPIVTGYTIDSFGAALVALIAFNSSYLAEIFRAGIGGVPRGLIEASRSTGMTFRQCFFYIVLPIAIRNILPALVNRFVALVMGTSLVYIIGVTEFFRAATNINNKLFLPYEIFLFVGIVYFVLCYSLSLFARKLQFRLNKGIA
jgi:polar amino acid transport system permease protein